MRRRDLLAQLARIADQVGPLAPPPATRAQLRALCDTGRTAFGAEAVSVARLAGTALIYEAAAGRGAAEIVGLQLPLRRGVAGYVARTGQSLAVEQVRDDPRFARDVAERTGYVPDSLLVVPVVDDDGAVRGVLSVLDRTPGTSSGLPLASALAAQAALLLPAIDAVAHLGPALLAALADAVERAEPDLGPALRREAERRAAEAGEAEDEGDDDTTGASLVRVAALLAELDRAGPVATAAAERILGEVVALSRRPRR